MNRHKPARHGIQCGYRDLGVQYKLIGKRHKPIRILPNLLLYNAGEKKADSHIDGKRQKLCRHIHCQSFFIHRKLLIPLLSDG